MIYDLQKASMWKRISAWLFDTILLGILAVAIAFLLSNLFGFDGYNRQVDEAYAKYELEYGIDFEITQEQYLAMTEEELSRYDAAYAALIADQDAMYAYNMVIHMTMAITTAAILLAYLVMEFAVPLWLGNGQTLGKKIFGIGLMRTDGIKISPVLLFIRTILGKFTLETMIPVYIVILIFFNAVGLTGTLILAGILALEAVLMITTHTNSMVHDLLAKTVVIDVDSQMIFEDMDSLVEYKKKIHAEQVALQDY